MENSAVCFIDSGIGGISIWQEFIKMAPRESTVYIGDQQYFPYGNRNRNFVRKRTLQIIGKALEYNIKLVVIACNTATVSGIDVYRKHYPDIPIIGVVPVIKTAVSVTKTGHIAVLSTGITNSSPYLRQIIRQYKNSKHVYTCGCKYLAEYVENGPVAKDTVSEYLTDLNNFLHKKPVDTVVLGCTHYPLIKSQIAQAVGDNIIILDSGQAVSRHIIRILGKIGMSAGGNNPDYKFYTSGDPEKVNRALSGLGINSIRFSGLTL